MKLPLIGRVWPYISAFAKTILSAADAAAARTVLGITAFDPANPGNFGTGTPGTITGTTITANSKVVVPRGSIAGGGLESADGARFWFSADGSGFHFGFAGFDLYSFTGNNIICGQVGGIIACGDSGQFQARFATLKDTLTAWELGYNGTPSLTGNASVVSLSSGIAFVLQSSTPASSSAAGVAGTITWDSGFIYICTATNTWKRIAILTW